MAEIAMFVSELATMMVKHDSHHHKCVACCLMCHGAVVVKDVNTVMATFKTKHTTQSHGGLQGQGCGIGVRWNPAVQVLEHHWSSAHDHPDRRPHQDTSALGADLGERLHSIRQAIIMSTEFTTLGKSLPLWTPSHGHCWTGQRIVGFGQGCCPPHASETFLSALMRDQKLSSGLMSGQLNLANFGLMLPMFMTTHLFQFRFADTGNHNLTPPLTLINWWPSSLITLTFFWTDDNHVPVVPGRDIFMNEYKVLKIPVWSGFYVMAVLIFVTFVRAGSMASSALFAVKRERPAERSLCLMSGVPMRRIFRWVKRNLRSSSTRNVWEKIAERCWMSASPGLTG